MRPFNDQGGMCRCIKAQYGKSSLANFIREGGMGATGVLVYDAPCLLYYGVSIHPFNRAMEFFGRGRDWWLNISEDVSPSLTAHDGKGAPNCVWLYENDDK